MGEGPAGQWADGAIRRLRCGYRPTPLRRVALPAAEGIDVCFKDESAHPTGSVKYRLVRAMFLHAIAGGAIRADTPVFAATGGPVAVAGARLATALGLEFVAVVPGKTPASVREGIEREGGRWQVGELPPAAVREEARALAGRHGGHFLDHFADALPAVLGCGEPTIAEEIFEQLGREPHPVPEWVVTGAGTGVTSATIGRQLRRLGRRGRLAVVDPENSAYFPAWATGCADYATGMPSRIPGIGRPRTEPGFAPDLIDLVIPVPDAASVAAVRWLRAVTGIEAGPATGAGVWGLCHLLARMREAGTRGSVVVVMGDGPGRYRATHLDPGWVRGQGLDPAPYEAALERFARTGRSPVE